MSDPTLRVDVDGHPVDLDAAVSEPGRETWLVRYDVILFRGTTGDRSALVRLVDLTGARDRMNGGYLAYGLVGLGVAGGAGGAVWWGLGRRLNKKVEPEDV